MCVYVCVCPAMLQIQSQEVEFSGYIDQAFLDLQVLESDGLRCSLLGNEERRSNLTRVHLQLGWLLVTTNYSFAIGPTLDNYSRVPCYIVE